jgi:hypothetical protein
MPAWIAVTAKLLSNFTVTSEPSGFFMCASYVAPSASVSTRITVPPGTALSPAAFACAASVPVSR